MKLSVLETVPVLLQQSGLKTTKVKFYSVSCVTIECNNPQSISEITELIFGNDFFELVASQTNLYHQQNEKPYKKYDKALKMDWCNQQWHEELSWITNFDGTNRKVTLERILFNWSLYLK